MNTLSSTVFNASIPTQLTNEIPHLNMWNILNKQIRMNWTRDLVGKSKTYFEDYNSIKTVLGEKSPNYNSRIVKFIDPDTNQKVTAKINKVNFDINGAWEVEADYLMHEMARYLSKLYPDDLGSLVTLTEKERQSYFNEAAHMIHSYFDTEQITVNDDTVDLYLRNRFLMNITAVRAETGIAKQESDLISLLNDGTLYAFSGYTTFMDDEGNGVVTVQSQEWETVNNIRLFKYLFSTDRSSWKTAIEAVNGKINNDGLASMLEEYVEDVDDVKLLDSGVLENFKIFDTTGLANEKEVAEIYVKQLNDLLGNGVLLNNLGENAAIESVIKTYGDTRVDVPLTGDHAMVFSNDITGSGEVSVLFINNEEDSDQFGTADTKTQLLCAEKIITQESQWKNLDKLPLFRTGKVRFSDSYKLVVGNYLMNHMVRLYESSEEFQDFVHTTSKNPNVRLECDFYAGDVLYFKGIISDDFLRDDFLEHAQEYTRSNYFIKNNWLNNFSLENVLMCINKIDENTPIVLDATDDTRVEWKQVNPQVRHLGQVMYLKNALTYMKGTEEESLYGELFAENEAWRSIDWNELEYGPLLRDAEIVEEIIHSLSQKYEIEEDDLWDNENKKVDPSKYTNAQLIDMYNNMSRQGMYEKSQTIGHSNVSITDTMYSINTIELPIESLIFVKDFIKNNTRTERVKKYSPTLNVDYFYKEYIVNDQIEWEGELVEAHALVDISTSGSDVKMYSLKTYKGSIFGDDVVTVEEDISRLVEERGEILACIIDNYEGKHFVKVYETFTRNGDCYVKFYKMGEPDLKLSTFENKDIYLILDLDEELSDAKVEEFSKERRKTKKVNIYRNDQFFLISRSWEPITQESLNYMLDNTELDAPENYARTSILSTKTTVPRVLTELEDTVVFDGSADDAKIGLVKDLIAENKSLYLDSSIRILQHVPLSVSTTQWSEDYGVLSFLYESGGLPAQISFYDVDISLYDPLQENVNFLKRDDLQDLGMDEAQKVYNRRYVVWGSVVWDANTDRSVEVLRTIWASYFSNFEIYSTEDIIPSELVAQSLGVKNTYSQNILNYDYAENEANPTEHWNVSIVSNLRSNSVTSGVIANCAAIRFQEENLTGVDKDAKGNILFENVFSRTKSLDVGNMFYRTGVDDPSAGLAFGEEPITFHNLITEGCDLTISYDNDFKDIVFMKYNPDDATVTLHTKKGIEEKNSKFTEGGCSYNNLDKLIWTDVVSTGLFSGVLTKVDVLHAKVDIVKYLECILKNYSVLHQQELKGEVNSHYTIVDSNNNVKMTDILDYTYNYATVAPVIPVFARMVGSELVITGFLLDKKGENKYHLHVFQFGAPFIAPVAKTVINTDKYSRFPVLEKDFEKVVKEISVYPIYIPTSTYDCNLNFKTTGGDIIPNAITKDSQVEVLDETLDTEDGDEGKIDRSRLQISYLDTDGKKKNIFLNNNLKRFKEYKNCTVSLSTRADEDNENYLDCIMTFDGEDLDLSAEGLISLYDMKVPDFRTRYDRALDNEVKVVERNTILDDLHITAFKPNDLDPSKTDLILMNPLDASNFNVTNAIEQLTPIDESVHTQKVVGGKGYIADLWEDAGYPKIGYSYYKRAFIANGVISPNDITRVTLSDESLIEDGIDLTKHITADDPVTLILHNPPSYYIGAGVNLELDTGTYSTADGPYKILHEETKYEGEDKGSSINYILAGKHSIVVVKVNFENQKVQVTSVFELPDDVSNINYVNGIFTLEKNGETYELRSTGNGNLPITADMFYAGQVNNDTATFDGYAAVKTVYDGENTQNVRINKVSQLVNAHAGYEDLGPVSIKAITTVGRYTIKFDDKDRVYGEAKYGGEPLRYITDPAALEIFDASGFKGQILTEGSEDDPGSFSVESIEGLTDLDKLKDWIVKTLRNQFGGDPTLSDPQFEGSMEESQNYYYTTAQGSGFAASKSEWVKDELMKILLNISANDVYNKPEGTKRWRKIISKDTIYVPTLEERDVEVVYDDNLTKWQKVYVINSIGNTLLKDCTDPETLQAFVKAILPTNFITRKRPIISTEASLDGTKVLWDQDACALTVFDKDGNISNRIAYQYLGLNYPVDPDKSGKNATEDWLIPNRIYLKADGTTFNKAFNMETSDGEGTSEYAQMYKEFEKYEVKDKVKGTITMVDGALYMPTLLANVNEDDIEIVTPDDMKFQQLVAISKDVEKWNAYVDYMKKLSWLAPDYSNYMVFNSPNTIINFQKLNNRLEGLKNDGKITEAQYNNASNVIKNINTTAKDDDCATGIIKGSPYLSFDNYKSNLYLTSIGVGVDSGTNKPLYFKSLITNSGILMSSNKEAYIYGTMKWPTFTEIRNLCEDSIKAKYSKMEGAEKDDAVNEDLNKLADSLNARYAKFETTSEEGMDQYKVGENEDVAPADTKFMIRVNLDTGAITPMGGMDAGKTASFNNLYATTIVNNKIMAITDVGIGELGSVGGSEFNPSVAGGEQINAFTGELISALKDAKAFNGKISSEGSKLTLGSSGTTVHNQPAVFTKVGVVGATSFTLEDDVIMADEGDNTPINVTMVVMDTTKDNFQYGYGYVEGLDQLNAAGSVFQVNSSEYADFATYEIANGDLISYYAQKTEGEEKTWVSVGSKIQGLFEPRQIVNRERDENDAIQIESVSVAKSVYPKPSDIDDELLGNFYDLDAEGNIKTVKNVYGREILRLADSTEQWGNLIKKVPELEGKDKILGDLTSMLTYETLEDGSISITPTVYPEEIDPSKGVAWPGELIGKGYDYVSKIGQPIPKMVDVPRNSVQNLPYTQTKFVIDPNADIYVGEDYLRLTATFDNPTAIITKELDDNKMNMAQTTSTEFYKDFTDEHSYSPARDGLVTRQLEVKVVNPTTQLPKLVDISNYKITNSSIAKKFTILGTKSTEIVIPTNGYGQSVRGVYTKPSECKFEDDLFYTKGETVNEAGETVYWVDSSDLTVKENGLPANYEPMRRMVYRSFKQADAHLLPKLATKEKTSYENPAVVIDLTQEKLKVDNANTIVFKSEDVYPDFFISKERSASANKQAAYNQFYSNVEFSCRVMYTKLGFDESSRQVDLIATAGLDRQYATRLYTDKKHIPTFTKYSIGGGKFARTGGSFVAGNKLYRVSEDGRNPMYLNEEGELTQTPNSLGPVHAIDYECLLQLYKGLDNIFTSIKVTNDVGSSAYDLSGLNISNNCLLPDWKTKTVGFTNNSNYKIFVMMKDLNEEDFAYQAVENEAGNKDLLRITTPTTISVEYPNTFKEYNLAYIKDKQGNIVAKAYFDKHKVKEDSLLVFSKLS